MTSVVVSKEAYGLGHPWELYLSPLSVQSPGVALTTLGQGGQSLLENLCLARHFTLV